MRLLSPVIALAVLLSASAAPALADEIVAGPWREVRRSDKAVDFVKAWDGAQPNRFWTRTEYVNHQPYLSVVTLYEYDCQERRLRPISIRSYESNNFEGAAVEATDGAWAYPPPGVLGETILTEVCRPAPAAAP